MPKPQPFTLHVPDADIVDLRARLARTRFPDQAPDAPWAYGTDLGYMRGLVEHWRTRFDWRVWEARLNAFPQFKVPLHGIDVHYLHVPGVGPAPKPLLLMHGWPGSVFEFLEMITVSPIRRGSVATRRMRSPSLRPRCPATGSPSERTRNGWASQPSPTAASI